MDLQTNYHTLGRMLKHTWEDNAPGQGDGGGDG